jgi:hypothetical protein
LIATNLVFERWTRAVANIVAAEDVSQEGIDRIVSRTAASASLTGMILITLGLVFVMVVKPTLVA